MAIIKVTSKVFDWLIYLFSILLWCLNGDHTQKDLTMFWQYTTYGDIKLLKSLYILDASPITYCKTLVFFKKNWRLKKN
jgi:hypothetical protein